MKGDLKDSIILTGGIATGKSTVCGILEKRGFRIVDADRIAHRMLDLSNEVIKELFGSEYVVGSKVDRKALGGLVFSDKEKLKMLEDLLHPKIREEIVRQVGLYKESDQRFIVDIPLFYETGHYDSDFVTVVYAPKDLQIERIKLRDSLSDDEIKERLDAQIPIDKKRDMADFVIDNSKDKKDLEKEIDRFLKEIDAGFKI